MKPPRIFYKTLSLWLLAVLMAIVCRAQTASTQGTDFWFSFMTNNNSSPTQICLILSAERACNVTVSNPNTGWTTSVSIPAGGRVDVDIPIAQAFVPSSNDNAVLNYGCHLVSTDVISAYTMNYRNASFDGAHLLPTDALADNYMVETIPPGINGSSVLIIGTEDNTVIDITPTAACSGGWAANTQHTITLNTGQVYQFSTTAATASLSGTVIQTRDCKRIAVFAGGKCAQSPANCTYCDHIYDPMIPTIYWGNHFAVTSSLTRDNDIVRVTALNSNTVVKVNGSTMATLASGGTYNFQLNASEGSCYIETSGPAVCYLYLTGQNCGGGSGDPSMVYITPIEQNIKKITFGTYFNSGTSTLQQYVNIVTPTSNVGSVTLDGASISGNFSPLTGNANYSYARLNITHATHTLQCDSGLIAHVYGLGNVTSYAYNVGSSAINLTNALFINDINTSELVEDLSYCPDLEIDFEVHLNYSYSNITWDFGDGNTGSGNPVPHSYESPGTYIVTALVERMGGNNCFGSIVDTLRGRVNIPPAIPIVLNETVCSGGSYDFNGRILTEAGIYIDTLQSSSYCDSIVELHLHFASAEPTPLYEDICAGTTYDFHGRILAQSGVYIDTLTSFYNCDSIIELHLNVVPVDPIPVYTNICQGTSYDFHGQPLTESGIYVDTLASVEGCDSIIELHLGIIPADPIPFYVNICPGDSYNFLGQLISEPGVYLDTVTAVGGCDSIVELHLSYAPVPTVSLGNDLILCGEAQFPVSVSAVANDSVGYHWNTGATTDAISVNQVGTYSVTVTNGYGCTATDEVSVLIPERITVSVEMSGDLCKDGSVLLTAVTNAPNVVWNTGETSTVIEAIQAGNYAVRAYDEPCEDTTSVTLPYCPPDLIFPNVLTPNGDGKNDVLIIKNLDPTIPNLLTIYDRWGKKIYEKANYQTYIRKGDTQVHNAEEGFSSEKYSDGVYYFTFHYAVPGQTTDYHGSLTIIR